MPSLLIARSWGTGFKAPTSVPAVESATTPGLSQAGLLRSSALPDPNDANNPDCNTQFTVTFGGNPQLKAEKANQTTIGAVWEPSPGCVDRRRLVLPGSEDHVTNGVPIATILDPALYSHYSTLVTRAATCAGGPPCPITAIDQRVRQHRQGQDPGHRRRRARPCDGERTARFGAIVTGTYYIKYDVQQPDGSYCRVRLQRVPGGGHRASRRAGRATSRARGNAGRGRRRSATRTRAPTPTCRPIPTGTRAASSLSLWDLQGSYTGFKKLTLTLGVKNLFDTNPPLTNSNLTFQSGYDPSYYDPRARFVYGSVRYAFR